jgi:hypothetical protein
MVGPLGRKVVENGRLDYLGAATRLPGRCPSLEERLGFGPPVVRRPRAWVLSASHLWRASTCAPRRGVGSSSEGRRPGCRRRSPPHQFSTSVPSARLWSGGLAHGSCRPRISGVPRRVRPEGASVLPAKGDALVAEDVHRPTLFSPPFLRPNGPTVLRERGVRSPLGDSRDHETGLTPNGALTPRTPFAKATVSDWP